MITFYRHKGLKGAIPQLPVTLGGGGYDHGVMTERDRATTGLLYPRSKGWLSGYSYRKSFTYSRASGAVENYQVKILVGESSGATGEDVDCGGHCLATFNDLRFTDSDGNLLDYWIESVSGETPNCLATVWVELDSVGTDATTYYMYYGKADAAAGSDGDATFTFFDHFPGSAIDGDKWTTVQGDVGVADSILTLTGTTGTRGLIEGKTGVTQGAAIGVRAAAIDDDGCNGAHFCSLRQTGDWNYKVDVFGDNHLGEIEFGVRNGAGNDTTQDLTPGTLGSYKIYEVRWTENKAVLVINGSTYHTHTSNVPGGTHYAVMYEASIANEDAYIDWIYIRQYAETEPALGSWGSEEAA